MLFKGHFYSTVRVSLKNECGSFLPLKLFNREVRIFILEMHNLGVEHKQKHISCIEGRIHCSREIIDQEIMGCDLIPLLRTK